MSQTPPPEQPANPWNPGGPPAQQWSPAPGQQWVPEPQRYGNRPTNPLAIVSLVTAVLGLGIVGIICGHIARSQIRRTGDAGDGLALAGLIVGYVITVLEVLVLVALFFAVAFVGEVSFAT